jgi:hypothetical protein
MKGILLIICILILLKSSAQSVIFVNESKKSRIVLKYNDTYSIKISHTLNVFNRYPDLKDTSILIVSKLIYYSNDTFYFEKHFFAKNEIKYMYDLSTMKLFQYIVLSLGGIVSISNSFLLESEKSIILPASNSIFYGIVLCVLYSKMNNGKSLEHYKEFPHKKSIFDIEFEKQILNKYEKK